MIAKDEAHVIERCLDSVKPLIDYVLVEDTGSSDGTQQVVRAWLDRENMPGQVIDEPFRDFAYNRTHALERLREVTHVDYALVVDADDVVRFEGDPAGIKTGLRADCYNIDIRHNGMVYQREQICSNRKPFLFRGVLHEFMSCLQPCSRERLGSVAIDMLSGGARARDPEVYQKDAAMLEKALAELDRADEDLRPRYLFYLAQSYWDAGDKEKALETYIRRVQIGGVDHDETYVALLSIGRLKEELEHPFPEVLTTYHQATQVMPARAEALHNAARLCRKYAMLSEGYEIARRGVALPMPLGLFVEAWIYQWGMLEEFAFCAFYVRRFTEAFLASAYILKTAELEDEDRTRIEKLVEAARVNCCQGAISG